MTWWDLRGDLLSHSGKTNKQTTAANCTAWSNCCLAVGSRNSMLCLTAQRAQTRPEKDKPLPKLQALVYDILPLEEDAGKRCSECDPVQALCRQVKIVLGFLRPVSRRESRQELVSCCFEPSQPQGHLRAMPAQVSHDTLTSVSAFFSSLFIDLKKNLNDNY